jgi:glycosyltransferase involved in cell wall biosynthesis
MHICLASLEYPPGQVGGIGTQCRIKARALAARGHEVEVLTCGHEEDPPMVSYPDENWVVHELRSPGGDYKIYTVEAYWLGYSWSVFDGLRRLGERSPFDVVDFADYSAEGFAYLMDRYVEDPTAVVVHLHGSLAMFTEKIGWPQPGEQLHRVGIFMEDLCIELADRLMAGSAAIAELTAERLGIPRERIDLLGAGVDTELFKPDPDRRAREAGQDGPNLLFAGSIAGNKGANAVVEAFVRLSGEHPAMTLTLAGGGDEGTIKDVRQRIAEAGLADRVHWLGWVEHERLAEIYRSADVLAVPSTYEGGLGMVYLEAMASGLPVVALAAGGAAEAVVDDETGILIEHGDAEETTAAIASLLADGELRARMGEAARRRALAEFGLEAFGRRLEECYERAIDARSGAVVQW